MPGIELMRSLFQQASAHGSRSTALNPIAWAFATVLSALIGSILVHGPSWVTAVLAVFAATLLVVFIFAYLYLMVKDRDALRSERFTLSKMAIEKSVMGDSLRGFREVEIEQQPMIVSPAESGEQDHS